MKNNLNRALLLLLAAVITTGCSAHQTGSRSWKSGYPQARVGDVVDDYHGVKVSDPYRWLEEPGSDETRAFVAAQNRLTFGYLQGLPQREALRSRLEGLWNFPRYSAANRFGDRYFFTRNSGLQNQSVVLVQEGLTGEPRVLLDPNTLSDAGVVALSGFFPSRDGRLVAYGLSRNGSDRQEFHVMDVDTGRDLSDLLQWCKFTTVAWAPDSSGFFYNRYPQPGSMPDEDSESFNRVYWHRLGTPQGEDVLVFERPDNRDLSFGPMVTEDGEWLILMVYNGTDPWNGLYLAPLGSGSWPSVATFLRVLEPGEAMFTPVETRGGRLILLTDLDAPRGRVISIIPGDKDRAGWTELIPQAPNRVIQEVVQAGRHLAVLLMEDASNRLAVHDLDGAPCFEVDLPGLGTVSELFGRPGSSELFFSFMSFLQPPQPWRMDLETRELRVWQEVNPGLDSRGFVTRQVFFSSRDGARVSMFLTHRKDLDIRGDTPVLIYGYGGFNISLTPYFKVDRLPFVQAGGIYALVNLRGGSEYGEDWHRAGMLERKQNVFDDLAAAAGFLVAQGYSNPEKIAIMGGSNGGLLVAAGILQQPDLFKAGVAQVPVTDMLRYQRFTVGRYWIPEYGTADDPAQFPFLHAYSPLHNVRSGVRYPALLVTTADTDDRVVPAHSFKFIARMQAAAPPDGNPALLRVETEAGHGRGKPTSKQIEEAADILAFLFDQLGMSLD